MLVDRPAVNSARGRGLHTAGRQEKSKPGSDSPADVSGTVRGGRGGGTTGRGRDRGGRDQCSIVTREGLSVVVVKGNIAEQTASRTTSIQTLYFRTLHSSQPAYLRSSLHACPSTRFLRLSNTNLLSAPRLSAPRLALAASASQPLKSGTLSLHLSVPVPVLIPSVVTSRPSTASRFSSPLNPSFLVPHIWLLLTIVLVYKLCLLTYLFILITANFYFL